MKLDLRLLKVKFHNRTFYFIAIQDKILKFKHDGPMSEYDDKKNGIYSNLEDLFKAIYDELDFNTHYLANFDGHRYGNNSFNFPCEVLLKFSNFDELKYHYAEYFI